MVFTTVLTLPAKNDPNFRPKERNKRHGPKKFLLKYVVKKQGQYTIMFALELLPNKIIYVDIILSYTLIHNSQPKVAHLFYGGENMH